MGTLLQVNLNHCRQAQDLLYQQLHEWNVGLAAVSEPYDAHAGDWLASANSLAALVVGPGSRFPPLRLQGRGLGYVVAAWGTVSVASCYVSPNATRDDFDAFLHDLGVTLLGLGQVPLIVMGDLNAKSVAWGNGHTDLRGRILLDWAAGLDLRVINAGSVPTCVRMAGGSVVDITLANAAAAGNIASWRVRPEVESLSDHRYITMVYGPAGGGEAPARRGRGGWNLKRFDEASYQEALTLLFWDRLDGDFPDVSVMVEELGRRLERACDAAMPRRRAGPGRRSAYWWNRDIAAVRTECRRADRA